MYVDKDIFYNVNTQQVETVFRALYEDYELLSNYFSFRTFEEAQAHIDYVDPYSIDGWGIPDELGATINEENVLQDATDYFGS